MTYAQLEQIIIRNNIPKNVILQSDSGWEGGETEMNGVYYNKYKNLIIFTQSCDKYQWYSQDVDWQALTEETE